MHFNIPLDMITDDEGDSEFALSLGHWIQEDKSGAEKIVTARIREEALAQCQFKLKYTPNPVTSLCPAGSHEINTVTMVIAGITTAIAMVVITETGTILFIRCKLHVSQAYIVCHLWTGNWKRKNEHRQF